jgi:hypothetical protein
VGGFLRACIGSSISVEISVKSFSISLAFIWFHPLQFIYVDPRVRKEQKEEIMGIRCKT